MIRFGLINCGSMHTILEGVMKIFLTDINDLFPGFSFSLVGFSWQHSISSLAVMNRLRFTVDTAT